MRRVAITGVGAITPVGCTVETLWSNIKAGRHGITKVENLDMTGQKSSLAAQVKDFDVEKYMDKHEARRLDPYARFASAAATDALADCGTDFADLDPFRVGVMIGSGIGGLQTMEANYSSFSAKGPNRVSALTVPLMIANAASGHVALRTGYKGVNYATVTACSSSTHALGEAFHAIRHGYADAVVAGGAEATITPFALSGFAKMTALYIGTDPDRASIPFDAERSGFVMGEGAGVLILEEWEHAKARGAKIYAEVAGYATTNDAYHITSPDPEGKGLVKSMEFAIKDAGLTIEQIGYINAHGTSTPPNDSTETKAIRTLFSDYADKLCVSSTKSMTGHMLGATGAVEAIISALSLRDGIVPPTANYKVKDPACDLDYVTEGARVLDYDFALSNTMGFGGHNATVCLKKFRG